MLEPQFLPSIPLLLSYYYYLQYKRVSIQIWGFFQKSVRTSDLFYSTKDRKKKREKERRKSLRKKGREEGSYKEWLLS